MKRIRPFLLVICCLHVCDMLRAQITVSGHVVDSLDNPIANASVTYRDVGKPTVLGYAMSKPDGSFQLTSKALADSIVLVVSHLSFSRYQQIIPNRSGEHRIVLESGYTELAEVSAAPFPIYKRKDTINYVVDAFTTKQDRVIGDIIRKLPGVDVINGRIYFQGKAIEKYMVNNLDLMEGRYGMINENMPADAVKNVQVVENDQPIKILDSLVFSDRASINLELKNPITTTGSGRAGAGASPALWQLNLTPMLFGSSFQSLASVQTNNTGEDAARSLRRFYTGGNLFRPSRDHESGPSYLSVRNVSDPDIDESKWLDNQLFLVSANVLQKLRNSLEVKGNMSFYNDRRIRRGFTATDIFAPDQRILLTEAVDNRYRINDLYGGLLVEQNEEHIYLRNRFSYHKRWNNEEGNLVMNSVDDIGQHRIQDDYSILNSLSLARFIGRQLVTVQSDIQFGETPQHLAVVPGQLADVLNNGLSYERMQQRIGFRGFLMENNLSFVRKIGRLSITPMLLANYRSNRLVTDILIDVSGAESRPGSDYRNQMTSGRAEVGAGIRIDYGWGKWSLVGESPYSFLVFDLEQQGAKAIDRIGRAAYHPAATASYSIDSRQAVTARTSYARRFDGLDNTYSAYILTDYRSLQRFSARLLGNSTFDSGLSYRYDNTLSGIFANIHYNYSFRLQDYLMRTVVDRSGQTVIDLADRDGRANAHSVAFGYGHFFQRIKLMAKMRVNGSLGQTDYLLNDILAQRINRAGEISLELNCSWWAFLGGSYRFDQGYSRNTLARGASNNVAYGNHVLRASFHAGKLHSIGINQSYYRTNIVGLDPQYFLDCSYAYHINKWKTDVILSGQNLFDNAHYTHRFASDYQLIETSFAMRPRQFLLSTRFRF